MNEKNKRDRYRAAIIGLGFIGGGDQVSGDALGQQVDDLDGTHFSALSGHPRINLVAGSSRDEGRRKRFAERSGDAHTYADWREMLDSEQLDIVSVATYAPQHAEITTACARRKVVDEISDKPMVLIFPSATSSPRAPTLQMPFHPASYRLLRPTGFPRCRARSSSP